MSSLAAAVFLFLAVQGPPSGVIEGVVVRAGTNTPIAGAQLTLVRIQVPEGPAGAFTGGFIGGGAPLGIPGGPQANVSIPPATADTSGRFMFNDLEPGTYLVRAAADGYPRQEYTPPQAGQAGMTTSVILAAGQMMKDVVLRLTPGGNVSGRITGSFGEPLAGIEVSLHRAVYDPTGRKTLNQVGTVQTNDRGEYRLFWITPGRYYLAAGSPTRPVPSGIPGTLKKFPTTFFPGAMESSGADLIEITSGSEMSADLRLEQQQLFRVRGRIIDSSTGQIPPRGVSLSIVLRDPPIRTGISGSGGPYNAADGTFELRDVAPGAYWVLAQLAFANRPQVQAGPPPQPPTALARVDVLNSDVEGVVLTVSPGISLSGHVRIEDQSPSTASGIERIAVMLNPAQAGGFSLIPGPRPKPMNSDGSFILDNVMPGEYRLNIFGLPAGVYIKEARSGSVDVLGAPFVVAEAVPDPLQIVLSAKSGELAGAVTTDGQDFPVGIPVVLVPDRRDRSDLFRTTMTDASGRFQFRTIPPGGYKVFSFVGIESNAFYDPVVLRQFEAGGRQVTIGESSRMTIDLKAIAAGFR